MGSRVCHKPMGARSREARQTPPMKRSGSRIPVHIHMKLGGEELGTSDEPHSRTGRENTLALRFSANTLSVALRRHLSHSERLCVVRFATVSLRTPDGSSLTRGAADSEVSGANHIPVHIHMKSRRHSPTFCLAKLGGEERGTSDEPYSRRKIVNIVELHEIIFSALPIIIVELHKR